MDSKAENDHLNLAHETKMKNRQCSVIRPCCCRRDSQRRR